MPQKGWLIIRSLIEGSVTQDISSGINISRRSSLKMKSIQRNNKRPSLVVLAPVTPKYSSRMFVLVEDFAIDGPDDTVIRMT